MQQCRSDMILIFFSLKSTPKVNINESHSLKYNYYDRVGMIYNLYLIFFSIAINRKFFVIPRLDEREPLTSNSHCKKKKINLSHNLRNECSNQSNHHKIFRTYYQ